MSCLSDFKPVEPLKENRFIINVLGANIPCYLFTKYKIFNEGDNLIFTTQFYETVNFSFNPKDFFDITGVKIDYLDPIGNVVNSLFFNVKGSNFERKQSYKNDGLQINKLRFIVDKNTMHLEYVINEEEKK
jgi:hypothetical protein